MNKMATTNHEWVWTELTESLRGINYPDSEIRTNGSPVPDSWKHSCPMSWVDKGYVREVRKTND